MSRCRITFLGSSSGMPSPTRFCSSIFFQTNRLNFLLDCGEGASFSLLRNKIDPLVIDSIFISHTHVDHLGGLFLLVQMMYLLQRRTTLEIFLPEEAIPGVKNFFNTCYLFPEKPNFRLSFIPVTPGFKFERQGMNLMAHPNRHLAANQTVIDELELPNKMQSYCFQLNLSGKKIVYSADIESAKDLDALVEGADVLITECVHPNLSEILSLIVGKSVKSAILTHIPPELELKQEEIVEKAKRMGFDKLSFAYDGLSIAI